jgi:acetyl esterase/lipase/DNA-binding FadR family transcriptional regulator
MALLIERKALGRADGIIAADLSEKMNAVEAQQQFAEDDGSYDLARTRAWLDEYSALTSRGFEIQAVPTEDRTVPGPAGAIPIRVYNPGANGPTLIFVHGGGWVIGSIATHDHIARWLAAQLFIRVVQIDYRLAPEHPYPAAIEDVSAVLAALMAEPRGGPILIGGDSAGANLAAMALLRLTSAERRQIAGFISIYGAYAPEMNLSSHRLYGDGRFGLSEAQMRWFWNLYAPHLPPEHRAKHLSPLTADLSDFPPTLCIGAECDVLLDDTLAFYGELAKASVDVSLSLWASLPHGCMHFVGVVDSVTEAADSIVQFIERHRRRPDETTPHHEAPPAAPLAAALVAAADTDVLVDVEPLFTTSRSRLHGSVAHRIAADIIRGELAQGSLLPNEDAASASFGVSRSAYREAIRTLAAKGLVSAQPKVGTRIAPRSAWHILDPDILAWHFELGASQEFIRSLFELRKIVEPSAAALAAMRRSDDDLGKLADSLARMAKMNPRTGAWLNAIIAFHQGLMTAGGNEAVSALWPAIQTTLRWSVKLQMMLPTLTLAHDPVADHARVFEKIASQSADGALTEMALLIDTALADTLGNFQRVQSAALIA